jgi:hypothetical protein
VGVAAVTDAAAAARLRSFLREYSHKKADITAVQAAIEDAFRRSFRPQADKRDVRDDIEGLTAATDRFVGELEKSRPHWPLLQMAVPDGSPPLLGYNTALAVAMVTRTAAAATQPWLRHKFAHDEPRYALGFEFALIYEFVTGQKPTPSNSATPGHPGTRFRYLV